MWTTLASRTLFLTSEGSDKFYKVTVEWYNADPHPALPFLVSTRFGRRGSYGRLDEMGGGEFNRLDTAVFAAMGILRGKLRREYTTHVDGYTPCDDELDDFLTECLVAFEREVRTTPGRPQTCPPRPGGISQEEQERFIAEVGEILEVSRRQEEERLKRNQERLRQEEENRRQEAERLHQQALENPEYDDFAPRVIDFDNVE